VIAKKFPDLFELSLGIFGTLNISKRFSKKTRSICHPPAARAGVRPSISDPLLYQDVNIRGTNVLLEACKEMGSNTSFLPPPLRSMGKPKVLLRKRTSISNHSPYGATKRAGELLCYSYHHLYGMNIACLRIFTAYGPRQRPEMAIHKFTRLIDQGENSDLWGWFFKEGLHLYRWLMKGFWVSSVIIKDSKSITSENHRLPLWWNWSNSLRRFW